MKHHLSLFRNENKVAHSRLIPTDQMVNNLEEKMKNDLTVLRENTFDIASYE